MTAIAPRSPDVSFFATLRHRIDLSVSACPFRWQLIIAVLVLAFVTGLAAGILAVFDARARAAVETHASLSLATQHIGERAKEVQSLVGFAHFAASVTVEMRSVRHISVRVVDMAGNLIAATPNALMAKLSRETDQERAPQWFVDLVQPDKPETMVEVVSGGTRLGRVIILGEPKDEIMEVWEMLQQMAILWICVMVIMTVGLYFLIGHILNPLVAFAGGLHELEDGHYAFRMAAPRVRELAVIADGFNKLAAALDRANSENSDLYRQLVSVQEHERRQLSRDLHDEFGPCIFGLTAGLGTIERHCRLIEGAEGKAIASCTKELVVVTQRLKSLTRSMLQKLRPVAIGRVSLSELISDLVEGFRRRHPDVTIELALLELPPSLGEAADVTVYRTLQEGLTNALRHGAPTRVVVSLTIETDPETRVRLLIEDNGIGISDATPRGYGLSGISERAKSLGGHLSIEPAHPSGTHLLVTLPFATT